MRVAMKLTGLATLAALVVRHVYALPAADLDVLTPTGIPATSGIPFSTLSFDTTAVPSLLSALSSLISSESTAVTPSTSHSHSDSASTASSSGSVVTSYATYAPLSSPTTTSSAVAASVTSTDTTSGARSLQDVHLRSGVVVGAAAVAIAALV